MILATYLRQGVVGSENFGVAIEELERSCEDFEVLEHPSVPGDILVRYDFGDFVYYWDRPRGLIYRR